MIITSTAEAIISRSSYFLGILQFLQCGFVCNLYCSTSQLDHAFVLEIAEHSSNYLPGGTHVARNGFMVNLEDVCSL